MQKELEKLLEQIHKELKENARLRRDGKQFRILEPSCSDAANACKKIPRLCVKLHRTRYQNALASLIFLSRWLQAPLYLGLIVAQGVYVYHFLIELFHLIEKAAHIDEKDDHAHGAGTDRRGDDRKPAHHGYRWRLRNLRLASASGGPSGPTGMALTRQRRRSQGQTCHSAHRHFLHPPA